MGTIIIDRTVYQVIKTGYGTRSILTVVLKNTVPIPNDYRLLVKFYDKDLNVISEQSSSGIMMPFGDTETTFTLEDESTMAEIRVYKILLPFILEDQKTVYPG